MADETETSGSDNTISSLLRTSLGDGSAFKLPVPPKTRTGEETEQAYKGYGQDIAAYKKAEAGAGAKTAQLEAASAKSLADKYEPHFQQTPDFHPSEENKATLIGLFGLIGAIGAFGGGQSYGSAVGAMNAMGGILKGYREGRKDLLEREKGEFDKHMSAVKSHNDEVMKSYARAKETAKSNLGVAQSKLVSELNALGATVQANEVKEKGIVAGEAANMKAYTAAKEQYDSLVKTLGAMTKGKGGTAGPLGGQIQVRYNQAVANAAYNAAVEVARFAKLPLSAEPPVVRNVLTDPAKNITDTAIKYFSAESTAGESRAFQQLSAGLSRAIQTISASGRPGGVTEAAIKEIK